VVLVETEVALVEETAEEVMETGEVAEDMVVIVEEEEDVAAEMEIEMVDLEEGLTGTVAHAEPHVAVGDMEDLLKVVVVVVVVVATIEGMAKILKVAKVVAGCLTARGSRLRHIKPPIYDIRFAGCYMPCNLVYDIVRLDL